MFASPEARCAGCHKVRGARGALGPDLSGLAGRDRKDVHRDIDEPSAWIRPDDVSYTLALIGGRVVARTVRAERADTVRIATSIMSVGLAVVIGELRLRDRIALLTIPPAK